MAILGFHFSGVYKEKLLNKKKSVTIMAGEHHFNTGEEIQVYLSDKPNLFDDVKEKRIGRATIKRVVVKKVKDLSEKEAILCGSANLDDLKSALKKWYDCDNNSVITFIRFKLELLSWGSSRVFLK